MESINNTTKIVHLIYQTRMCLVTTARDFVVMYHWIEIEKNMFIVVAQSVKSTKVPVSVIFYVICNNQRKLQIVYVVKFLLQDFSLNLKVLIF